MTKRKIFATVDQAKAQYHALNAAKCLPRKGTHVGAGKHVTIEDDPAKSTLGWSITCCEIVTKDGANALVFDEADAVLDKQIADVPTLGTVTIALDKAVEHDEPETWTAAEPILPPKEVDVVEIKVIK
jgi:hypothetical protein